MKMLYIAFICVILFLVAIAVYDPLKQGMVSALTTFGGGAYEGISLWWGTVTATSAYQSYHMLLWLAAGVLLTVFAIKAYRSGKVPLIHPSKKVAPQQPIMQQPQTIIVREMPTPTMTSSPTFTPTTTTIPVPDQTKKAQEATVPA